MRVVVTGGTGFIGRSLARHLAARGDDVYLLVRDPQRAADLEGPKVRIHRAGDAEQTSVLLRGASPDVVVHLATHFLKSHTVHDIRPLITANVEFGTVVLDAAADISAPVVLASSFFQFRHGRAHPSSLYAATKQALATIAEFYRTCGADVREVVLYDTYGPGDSRDKLIPLLVDAARTGGSVSLGAADQPINLTYVDDVVRGLAALLAADTDAAPITAIRNPVVPTVGEVVEVLSAIAPMAFSVSFRDGAPVNDLPLVAGDWPAPPGWRPEVDLAAGLALTLGLAAADAL